MPSRMLRLTRDFATSRSELFAQFAGQLLTRGLNPTLALTRTLDTGRFPPDPEDERHYSKLRIDTWKHHVHPTIALTLTNAVGLREAATDDCAIDEFPLYDHRALHRVDLRITDSFHGSVEHAYDDGTLTWHVHMPAYQGPTDQPGLYISTLVTTYADALAGRHWTPIRQD